MPTRLAYDEAMTFSAIRMKVQDPEIKQGKVEMLKVKSAVGVDERPWGIEGAFAVVYKFRTQKGKIRALRCFRVPLPQDIQFRYERMAAYFQAHAPGITAGFRYHPVGIVVKDQGLPLNQPPYPNIERDLIEGETLLDKVDELCKKVDQAGLKDLTNQWVNILMTMRRANMAHGDLSAVNTMLQADGKLVLVDYDGVYIPEFARLQGIVLGQEQYQHPQMAQREFNEHMDHFSGLVIYTALLALSIRPALWNKYMKRSPQGKLLDVNMLFVKEDFERPDQSALLNELLRMTDPQVKVVAQALKQACQQPIDQVRFNPDPDFEKKEALVLLDKAVKDDNDVQIIKLWPTLQTYPPALKHTQRVKLAQEREKALKQFRSGLVTKDARKIVASYDMMLDYSSSITKEERERLNLARSYIQAYDANDDEALATTYETMQSSRLLQLFIVTPQERQHSRAAQKRKTALVKFQWTLERSKRPQEIVDAYDPILDNSRGITERERGKLTLAQNFVKAYKDGDDEALVKVCDEMQGMVYCDAFKFTTPEEERIGLARKRKAALVKFRWAFNSRRPDQIVAAYDSSLLDQCKNVAKEEREQLALAKDFVDAYRQDNDEVLVAAWESIQNSPYRKSFTFTTSEQERLTLAEKRQDALKKFQAPFLAMSRNAHQIVAAYDPLLDNCKNVTKKQRELLTEARKFLKMYDQVVQAIKVASSAGNDTQIMTAYDKELAVQFTDFTAEQQQHIDRVVSYGELEYALSNRIYGLALQLARDIELKYKRPIIDMRLSTAMKVFIREADLTGLNAFIDSDEIVATWQWPLNDLVQYAAIAWRFDGWPEHARLGTPGTFIQHVHRNQ